MMRPGGWSKRSKQKQFLYLTGIRVLYWRTHGHRVAQGRETAREGGCVTAHKSFSVSRGTRSSSYIRDQLSIPVVSGRMMFYILAINLDTNLLLKCYFF